MTLSAAELRTKRQSLGLTPRHIAERAGVHYNVAWRAEAPGARTTISEAVGRVHDAIAHLESDFYEAVHREERTSRNAGHISRPRTPDEFYARFPILSGWPEKSVGMFYAEVERRTHLPIDYTKE